MKIFTSRAYSHTYYYRTTSSYKKQNNTSAT
jgi:hypothetical protein